jgi:hypothetical protein
MVSSETRSISASSRWVTKSGMFMLHAWGVVAVVMQTEIRPVEKK